jgi:hypothetical protein
MLECEEAIEAIDAAIEYKNELICGRKGQGLDNSRVEREKVIYNFHAFAIIGVVLLMICMLFMKFKTIVNFTQEYR